MASEDYSNLRHQVDLLNKKVDLLSIKIEMICNDLGVNHGAKVYAQLNEIVGYLRSVNKDITEGQMSTIKYKMDSLMKSIEYINSKMVVGERG